MNILSLFDGCGMSAEAIKRTGLPVNKIYTSEIDKYSSAVARFNDILSQNNIELGDIKHITHIPDKIDLLIGGSPCQGFSFAGKQLNFNDERSKLLFEYVRLLKACKPKYFILENVVMKKEYQDVISNLLDVEPIMINSALVSAQNRKRLYWTNIAGVKQPENRHIYLKCILESGDTDRLHSYCIDANYHKGSNLKQYFKKSRRQLVFDQPIRVGIVGKGGQGERIYHPDGKSITLSALGGGMGTKTGLYCVAQRGRYQQDKIIQQFEPRLDEKTNCVTTVTKDNLITDGIGVRKLTPTECERLQTLPDGYTKYGLFKEKEKEYIKQISDSQRYKMLGNGFTVDVISHILSYIKESI